MTPTPHRRRPARARPTPKGRQIDASALDEIDSLLNGAPVRRDLLIEYLHAIQDRYGHLSAAHLGALAHRMGLAQAEVYEVATFYSHFDVVKEGDAAPPDLTVRVCDGIACEMAGARELLTGLERRYGPNVRVLRAPCMGRCDTAPAVQIGQHHEVHASLDSVARAIDEGRDQAHLPDYVDYTGYLDQGGYKTLRECLNSERNVEEVFTTLENSALRGLGGAGFPTGRKWRIVSGYPGPRLMAVNADEGEPGTFKDRYYLERDPHRFIEGMLIAAWAVGVDTCYVYVRDEYPALRRILATEIEQARINGLAGHCEIELRRGAGAYICGEESAMIESIEGKRGLPRNRPPYVAEVGLFGRPTLENNVETLFWIRDILERGAAWYAEAGRHGCKGWRSYSVSGRVKQPGVKLAPAGITVRELIDEFCGGMRDGHVFKAYLPGGASGGILPASLGDEPLDFGTLERHGCLIGSAAVVVFSQADNMCDVALNLLRFFEDESCGQCTPCRVGTEKAVKLMESGRWNTDLLAELCRTMTDASICGLGQAAGNPINSVLRFFPEDLR